MYLLRINFWKMEADSESGEAVFHAMPIARWQTGKEIGRKTSSGEQSAGIFGKSVMPSLALTSPATENTSAPSKMILGAMPAKSKNWSVNTLRLY